MAMEEINEKIMHYSRLLRLPGFRKYYQSLQTEMPDDKVDYNEYLSKLLELEYQERKERRKKLQIRQAGFPQLKYLQERASMRRLSIYARFIPLTAEPFWNLSPEPAGWPRLKKGMQPGASVLKSSPGLPPPDTGS